MKAVIQHIINSRGNRLCILCFIVSVAFLTANCTAPAFLVRKEKYAIAYKMPGEQLIYKLKVNYKNPERESDRESVIAWDFENVGEDGTIVYVTTLKSHYHKIITPHISESFLDSEELIGKRTRKRIMASGRELESVHIDSLHLTGWILELEWDLPRYDYLIQFPHHAVGFGDKWTVESTEMLSRKNGQISATQKLTYTLLAQADTLGYRCLEIGYEGHTTHEGDWVQAEGPTLFIEGKGEIVGKAYFDHVRGILVARKDESLINSSIKKSRGRASLLNKGIMLKTSLVLQKNAVTAGDM